MKTRTYKGKKFNDLIETIENKYNDNYKILKQREVNKVPLLFWTKQYEIEIEVIEEKEQPVQKEVLKENAIISGVAKMERASSPMSGNNFESKKRMILDMLDEKEQPSAQNQKNGEQSQQMEAMQKMMEEMMLKLESKEKNGEGATSFLKGKGEELYFEYYEKLIESEVESEIAKGIVKEAQVALNTKDWETKEKVEASILESMSNKLKVTGELNLNEVKVMALIGPTGVGKTTTIAKIAGYMTDRNKKVGLITTDVFRIGATDQLQIYANILDSEMIAVNSPDELRAAIDKLENEYRVDHILVDTVGRSPLDVGSIDDVKEYLNIAKPDHVGLVLSSTQKSKDVTKILENFESVNIKSLLFTKLDETINHGVILNASQNGKIGISYVTNGQNVPYDIYQADSMAIAKKILNGVDEFGSSIFSA